jgi:hypothetical protein
MNIFSPITAAAIEVAERNADKAELAGYYVTAGLVPGNFLVHKNETEFYVTQTTIGTRGYCGCEQYKKVCFCKHLVLTERYQDWVESVEARELEFDTNEEARFFMEEVAAENLAELAGAWY